ncbi:MAG: hypothetical protein IPQ04_14320 [Saprospiraceae bacterium]|nr:hypothetical protein [Saprospiraceae bacterium]
MYAIRIKKSRINGIYIPEDINEAMKDIDERIDSAGEEKFKQVSEKESAKNFISPSDNGCRTIGPTPRISIESLP